MTLTKMKGIVLFLLFGAVQCDVMTADGPVDSEEAGQIAGQATTNCSCGYTYNSAGRIVGGVETTVNEYPYMALLVRRVSTGWSPFCGGSIITARHVLTAAHCTSGFAATSLAVDIGEHDYTRTNDTTYQRIITVSRINQHVSYNSRTTTNDISILTTSTAIPFSVAVGPICLPTARQSLVGQYLRVTGWGTLAYQGAQSRVLMKVDLQVIPLTNCSRIYGNISTTNPTQLCTYTPNKDSCQGDSGGPLAWLDPATNRFVQAALVSYGNGCAKAGYPGVNTDVSAYVTWIQQQLTATAPFTGNVRQRTCSKV